MDGPELYRVLERVLAQALHGLVIETKGKPRWVTLQTATTLVTVDVSEVLLIEEISGLTEPMTRLYLRSGVEVKVLMPCKAVVQLVCGEPRTKPAFSAPKSIVRGSSVN